MANARNVEMIGNGVSLSGHERNCCFLNTGERRFANISAASGLDHIGDGRAYALVDWDHDGDLDLWTTNRTGPRVQFLRNNNSDDHHFLALKLVGNGTTTNRDAIGARVELILENPKSALFSQEAGPYPKSIKTLRAGEGFLGQTSKIVHFGLGDHERINRIDVHWPAGDVEQFTGLNADRMYRIVQGSGRADVLSRPGGDVALQASGNSAPPATDLARIPLRFPIPLPTFQYENLEGKKISLDDYRGSPTLLNLWASWCRPCLVELTEFRDHSDELRDIGLTVVALSVDAVAEDAAANEDVARSLLERQTFPFPVGMADAALVHQLEMVLYYLFDHQRSWGVPTSFLLNSEGRLAAIYVGPLDIDDLMLDAENLQSDEESWLAASPPFPGRWAGNQRQPDMWRLVAMLFDKNYSAEAMGLFDRLEKLQAPTSTYAKVLVKVGAALSEQGDLTTAADRLQQSLKINPQNADANLQLANVLSRLGRTKDAVRHCREVLQLQPENVDAHVGLGNLLQTMGQFDTAMSHLQSAIELKPNHASAHYSLGVIDASQKQWDRAIEHLRIAVRSNPDLAEAHHELGRALQKSDRAQQAIDHYQHAVRLNPKNVKSLYALGATLAATDQTEEAIQSFRQAHRLNADSLALLNGLAWLLATRPGATSDDSAEAARLAEEAARKTEHKNPQILDTLAATYAAIGDFDKAESTAQQAIALATARDRIELANEIRMRLELYQQGQPYRESAGDH